MKPNKEILKLDFKSPHTWIATWFGAGLMRPAPGTWGTLAAMPFAIILSLFDNPLVFVAAAAIAYIIGIRSVRAIEAKTKLHDPSFIVIDEVVGLWIAFLGTATDPVHFALAFVLFRFFDIVKPFPIGYIDKRLKTAEGVMIDDVIAGIFAAITLIGIRYGFNI